MLRGLTTVSFFADDVAAAGRWYADLLGVEPYFVRPVDGPPAYIEFRIGDFQDELGIIDRSYSPHGGVAGPAGSVIYWQVDDVPAAYAELLSRGAQPHEPPLDREAGFVTASVVDPFGNILGIMFSPHYLEVTARCADGPA